MNLLSGLAEWFGFGADQSVSRHDGDNFRTNRVSLAEMEDRAAGASGVLGLSAAWACVNLLAGTIGTLPIMVYTTSREGVDEENWDHSLYRVLSESPNADQTPVDYFEFASASVELHGNAYSEIERGGDGRVIALLPPVAPELMTVRRISGGALQYDWTDYGKRQSVAQERMFHVRGFGGGPLGGMSTLAFGSRAFNSALAIERAAAATFRNGVRPSGVLSSDEKMSPETRKETEELLQQKYMGTLNQGLPMLLTHKLTWQQLTINPEDAQMLQSRAFSVEEICRFFGVPPHMIGHTEKTTSWGTGLTEQRLGFLVFTLRRRLKRFEQAMGKQLLSPADRAKGLKIKFDLRGLMRGDDKARSEFYEKALRNGWMTINEVRALEGLPPVEGGNVVRMQMQNQPINDMMGHNGGPSLDDEA